MKKYVWQFAVDLPGGSHCVAVAEVPDGVEDVYDATMAPKREFWVSKRLFKRKVNADRYQAKVFASQRNYNLNRKMEGMRLFCFN
jgi:hypothetical protein